MQSPMIAAAPPRRGVLSVVTVARHLWNLTPITLAHVGGIAAIFLAWSWQDLLVMFGFLYFRGFFVAAGYHRYFSHRSFKISRIGQFIMACCCCCNLQQGPLWWAVHHRHHHRNSDTSGDVHSPYFGGLLWAYCGWVFVPLNPDWHYVRDLRRYPELVWLERFWQVPGILLAALCYWIGGWHLLCIGFCVSALISYHMSSIINTVGHIVG